MKILITGATGFVGRAVTESGCLSGYNVTALVRNISDALPEQVSQIAVGDFANLDSLDECSLDSRFRGNDVNIVISSEAEKSQDASTAIGMASSNVGMTSKSVDITNSCHSERSRGISKGASITAGMTVAEHIEPLISAMQDIDVVIHTAARAHVMKERHSNPADIYRQINVAFTQQLAEAAAEAGVKRFVFLSSIKVDGEATLEQPFTEADLAEPTDVYAKSKWQAEQLLREIGKRSGMEIVILRPPMIYGPGVKGNFANLIKLVNKGIPLPFGKINNKRSLLALDNLVSAILLVAEHPSAGNQTYLIADDEAVSTTQLIKYIANAQGKKHRLLPIPVSLMIFAAKVLGKQSVADRLFGSLQIDTSKIQNQLGWRPVVTMRQQLEKMFSDMK